MAVKQLPPWLRELGEKIEVCDEVLQAMNLPREKFIDQISLNSSLLTSVALPIGSGQTISQPITVAKMTQALYEIKPKKVLEIGTGSGFQTAVLSRLVDMVYTIERIQNIQLDSIRRLYKLDIYNFKAICSDGSLGWATYAPYDAIIVTAAAQNDVPQALLEQLKVGGRMIIPVGTSQQRLVQIDKKENGEIVEKSLGNINFVPLITGETS
ncbi:MAG: protein-L-isoaspartate(D-aspartate) O-methyltransferase [Succinivibrionaceae bacterium]|nr:protein-L-isoaspartate(D-aspartate) O-methyltransferase [Succinivibrionaceae bacterium]